MVALRALPVVFNHGTLTLTDDLDTARNFVRRIADVANAISALVRKLTLTL
jgi:hypothetical protein